LKNAKKYILIIVYALCAFTGFAQSEEKKCFMVTGDAHVGYIISHRNNMSHLIKGHVGVGELNFVYRTEGCKPWHQVYKYPELGVSFMHFELGNPKQLGSLEALYPYSDFRLNKINPVFSLTMRVGVGVAYLTKPFDIRTNHKNNAIGSHLNGFVNLRLNAVFTLSKNFKLNTGLGMSHASNGAMRTPNLGLNIPTIHLGLSYAVGNKNWVCKKDSIEPLSKKWRLAAIAAFGIKELEPPTGRKYVAYTFQLNAYKPLNYKNRLGGGVDFVYNNALKTVWEDDGVYNYGFKDIFQVGVKVGYEYRIHRLSLPIEFGFYVFKKQSYNGSMFHRIGFRYNVTKHLIANLSLRTHFAKADYFEWGLGYQF